MAQQKKPSNRAKSARVTRDAVVVKLKDGRTISTPLSWHSPLINAKPVHRKNVVVWGAGSGIEWPDLDYDVCVEWMLDPLGQRR